MGAWDGVWRTVRYESRFDKAWWYIAGVGLLVAWELFKRVDWDKPKKHTKSEKQSFNKGESFSSKITKSNPRACIYNEKPGYKATHCQRAHSV